MTEPRPVYLWRDHLRAWHGLDPDTYDLAELLVLHGRAHDVGHSVPHTHDRCPRCGHVGGVTLPATVPETLDGVPAVGCDTCDTLNHPPACVTTGRCLCRLDPDRYPIPPTTPTPGDTP